MIQAAHAEASDALIVQLNRSLVVAIHFRHGFREWRIFEHHFAPAPRGVGFEALLSVPDWQMFDWIMGHVAVPSAYDHEVFARLCAYRNNFPS